jgi:hypothetical protein
MMLILVLAGCGGGSGQGSSDQEAIGQGSAVARCKHAIAGPGVAKWKDWRQDAVAAGRAGFWGSGRDFRSAQKVARSSIQASHQLPSRGPILETKTPMIVEGRRPVVIEIAPEDRVRAGYMTLVRGGPYAEIRFIPCRDRPGTAWPGGFVLRDRQTVRVLVQDGNGPPSQLIVGRP